MQIGLLQRSLKSADQAAHTLQFEDGSRVLVLVHGGRVLGLFPPSDDENFLWTQPALASGPSTRRFFSSPAWCNSGGDRTWLSPEMDVFLPQYPDLQTYFQPRLLDPGHYELIRGSAPICLRNRLSLRLSRPGCRVRLAITKSVEASANPLAPEAAIAAPALKFAGYRLRTTLSLKSQSSPSPVALSLWNLLQLPHGGEMLIPTYGCQEACVLMGAPSPADLRSEPGCVRWRMHSSGEHKVSLKSVVCTGRAGYLLRRTRKDWDLVVRQFQLQPGQCYPDAPWRTPSDTGHAVQACSVNSTLGAFSELEYHAPAVTSAGLHLREDVSDVWAFRGSPASIRKAVTALLGVKV